MIYLFSSKPATIAKYFDEKGMPYTVISKEEFGAFAAAYSPANAPADLGIVYDFGKFIPELLLERLFMLNIHFSLLPKYRGAIPVEAAILNGETETGISIQKMVKKMDEGDLLLSYPVDIKPFENAGELQARMDASLPELLDRLFATPQQNWQFTPQIGEPTYCFMKELDRENAEIDWRKETVTNSVNKVRGYNPEPKAWIRVKKNGVEKTLNILRAEKFDGGDFTVQDYSFVKKRGLVLKLQDGAVLLTEIVLEGSKMVKNGDIVSLKESVTI